MDPQFENHWFQAAKALHYARYIIRPSVEGRVRLEMKGK